MELLDRDEKIVAGIIRPKNKDEDFEDVNEKSATIIYRGRVALEQQKYLAEQKPWCKRCAILKEGEVLLDYMKSKNLYGKTFSETQEEQIRKKLYPKIDLKDFGDKNRFELVMDEPIKEKVILPSISGVPTIKFVVLKKYQTYRCLKCGGHISIEVENEIIGGKVR